MKQNDFMQRLKNNLNGISLQERQEILDDYRAHFEAGKAAGKTEEQISQELGNPYEIAGMYKTELVVKERPQESNKQTTHHATTSANGAQLVIVILALIAFNVMVMLPLVGTILGVVVSLFATALVIIVSGLTLSIASLFASTLVVFANPVFGAIALVLWGIVLICFGVLFFIGMVYVTKWLVKLMGMYVNFNIKLVKEAEGSQK